MFADMRSLSNMRKQKDGPGYMSAIKIKWKKVLIKMT
jgi:hypothetical protein